MASSTQPVWKSARPSAVYGAAVTEPGRSTISKTVLAAVLLDFAGKGGTYGLRTLKTRSKGGPRASGLQHVTAAQLAASAGRLLAGVPAGTVGTMAREAYELRLSREGLEVSGGGWVWQLVRDRVPVEQDDGPPY